MKKRTWALLSIFFFIASSFIFTGFNISEFFNETITGLAVQNNIEVSLQEDASIQVFFCPQDHCAEVFLAFLDTAQNQVYCALHEADHEKIN